MSIDLFVTRPLKSVTWQDAQQAFASLGRDVDGLAFIAFDESVDAVSAYFSNVARVDVSRTAPLDEEAAEEEVAELRSPFLVISSRSGAWPWIEFTAVSLARCLGGRVYDPQQGTFFDALVAEHDAPALRALHDEDIRERKPTLVTKRWAICAPGTNDAPLLQSLVEAVGSIGRDVGLVPPPAALSVGQVNWSHTLRLPRGGEIHVSSYAPYPGTGRTIHLEGPPGCADLAVLADRLSSRLEVGFRGVDEYK